jgi:hypothetical protein
MDEVAIQQMMGFGGFDTTKGKGEGHDEAVQSFPLQRRQPQALRLTRTLSVQENTSAVTPLAT